MCRAPGRIPNGATIERAVPTQIAQGDAIILNLNDPDFTTATRLVASVNKGVGDGMASIIDGGSVRVQAPMDITQRVAFLSTVENLEVDPASAAAKVIINSRTGTVVISSNVRVSPAAVSHGSLTVSIKEEQKVSQPGPFSKRHDHGDQQLDHQRRSGIEPHVPVQARCRARTDRACGQRGRRRAGRSGRDLGSTEGSRRAASRAGGDLVTAPLSPTSLMPPAPAAAAPGANTYTDLNGLAALKNAPTSPQTIRAVSEQVEALFLQMMLKSMRDAQSADGELDSNETSMYQDMFDKQVALTLSKRQDLGISRLFERQLGGKSPSDPTAAPASLPHKVGDLMPRTDADGHAAQAGEGATTEEQAAQFVQKVYPTIQRAAQTLGVNPVGMLAQAALETGWGRRMPRTADGSSSLNLFGVKAGNGWNGARAVADTVEFSGGVATQRRTAFRAYGSIEESVQDFANLLANSPRYREAVSAGGSAQAYVQEIAKSGYATDPEYGNKLNQTLNSGDVAGRTHHASGVAIETAATADRA